MRQRVIVIAEAGVNHNGDVELAKRLIDVAAEAGADFVKFQTFTADQIAGKQARKADYQARNTNCGEDQLSMLRKLELSKQDHRELIAHCRVRKIAFLSTPFDIDSIRLLRELGVTLGKIPSGEITNLPYLKEMAKSFEELILSTGMADMREIEDAVHVITATGFSKSKLTVLHCNTEYPTPFRDVNLLAMNAIGRELDVKVGYSDHTTGIEVPIAAVALGATIIEKHFTLSRSMEGPDHKASLEPEELKAMVASVRNIETALGNANKTPSPSEIKNKEVARKSIVAATDLKAGHVLRFSDLAMKRPGTGISPMLLNDIIGKRLVKDVGADELLNYSHFV